MPDTFCGEDPKTPATPNVAITQPPMSVAGAGIIEPKTTVEKVKEEASTFAGEATDAARRAATQGKDKAAEALTGLSKLANEAASAVDQHLGSSYGDYARKASTGVENAAAKLQAKDVDELVADATDFVKKRPAMALGALAAVGLVLVGLFTTGRSKNNSSTNDNI